jgi:hypothetical protein
MAYQVNFNPGLFMASGVKADQERIAPFKQGISKLSNSMGDVVSFLREREAQKLWEKDVANRARWKKIKDQLANPEMEEYEEEVRVPVETKVPEVPTPLAQATPKAPEPKFEIRKVKKTRQKQVELPSDWEELETAYNRPLSEQYLDNANRYRILSPRAAAAMERKAEQERQLEAQLARDAAQSDLRIREQGGMPELLPLKAQQAELIKQIAHYDKMLSEPMAMEFRDSYVAAKQQSEVALAQINNEIMRKMGIEVPAPSEGDAEMGASVDRAAQLAYYDIKNAMSKDEIDQILAGLHEGTSKGLRAMLTTEARKRSSELVKLTEAEVKAQKENTQAVAEYFKDLDTDSRKIRKQMEEARRVYANFKAAPSSYGKAKQNLEAAARVLADQINATTGKSLTLEGVLTGVLGLNLGKGEITADAYNTAMQTIADQLAAIASGHNASVDKSYEALVGTAEAPVSNPGIMNDVAGRYAKMITVGVPTLKFGAMDPSQGPLLEGVALDEEENPEDVNGQIKKSRGKRRK